MSRQLSLSQLPAGCTLVRAEMADGCTYNVDDAEAARRIEFGDVKFRAMPGGINGDLVIPFLYRVLRLDPHRFTFDLPSSITGNGSARTGYGGSSSNGHREGFVFEKGKPDHPVGRLFFLSVDRRFADRDPTDRKDFEVLK